MKSNSFINFEMTAGRPYSAPKAKSIAVMTKRTILQNSLKGNTPGISEDDENTGFSDF